MDFERNYQVKIPSKQLKIFKSNFSTSAYVSTASHTNLILSNNINKFIIDLDVSAKKYDLKFILVRQIGWDIRLFVSICLGKGVAKWSIFVFSSTPITLKLILINLTSLNKSNTLEIDSIGVHLAV